MTLAMFRSSHDTFSFIPIILLFVGKLGDDVTLLILAKNNNRKSESRAEQCEL
jgi:hypothetical protein